MAPVLVDSWVLECSEYSFLLCIRWRSRWLWRTAAKRRVVQASEHLGSQIGAKTKYLVTTSMGKNMKFNQVRGHFTPFPSPFSRVPDYLHCWHHQGKNYRNLALWFYACRLGDTDLHHICTKKCCTMITTTAYLPIVPSLTKLLCPCRLYHNVSTRCLFVANVLQNNFVEGFALVTVYYLWQN